jgi:hypothetical protein
MAPLDEFRHSSGIIVANFEFHFRKKSNAERAAMMWCYFPNAHLRDARDIDEQQIDV